MMKHVWWRQKDISCIKGAHQVMSGTLTIFLGFHFSLSGFVLCVIEG